MISNLLCLDTEHALNSKKIFGSYFNEARMYHSNYWNWSGTDTICLSENLVVILYPLLHALDTADATHNHNLLFNQILIYSAI